MKGNDLKFDYIFILTYGRSGSTLLQGLLNRIDGVLVRGENNNFVFKLFEAYETLRKAVLTHGSYSEGSTPAFPWYGIDVIDENAFLVNVRKVVTTVLLSDRINDESIKCIGFKEIRYPSVQNKLSEYLIFLSKLFPKSGFIVLTRDLDDVKQSAWWADEDPGWVVNYLTKYTQKIKSYALDRDEFFFIDYSDIIDENQKLRDMYDFLGAPYDQEIVSRTLSTPHSYVPKGKEKGRRLEQESCKNPKIKT